LSPSKTRSRPKPASTWIFQPAYRTPATTKRDQVGPHPGDHEMIRVYNQQHRFYCGVDLHARTMYTHILDHAGKALVEKNLPATFPVGKVITATGRPKTSPRQGGEVGAGWFEAVTLMTVSSREAESAELRHPRPLRLAARRSPRSRARIADTTAAARRPNRLRTDADAAR